LPSLPSLDRLLGSCWYPDKPVIMVVVGQLVRTTETTNKSLTMIQNASRKR
jgi:hypothetical protein